MMDFGDEYASGLGSVEVLCPASHRVCGKSTDRDRIADGAVG